METATAHAPVETASGTTDQPTAPAAPDSSASSAVETPSQSPSEALAQAEADLKGFYEAPTRPEAGNEEKTEELAPAATEQPAQPKADEPKPEEPKAPQEEDDDKLPNQIRPRLKDPGDIAIAQLAKSKGWTLAKAAAAIAAAEAPANIPGLNGAPTPTAEPSPAQQLESEIAALAAEIKTERQGDEFLSPAHLEKVDRLADLRSDLKLARFQERQTEQGRQQSEAQSREAVQADNVAATCRDYPTISDVASPLGKAASAVFAEWGADPVRQGRLTEPNAPQMIAAEAAYRTAGQLFAEGRFATLDLALASLKAAPPAPAPPAAPKAPAPLSSPAPTPLPQAPRRVAPAAGSRGQLSGDQPTSLAQATAEATTAKDANALLEEFYGKAPLIL